MFRHSVELIIQLTAKLLSVTVLLQWGFIGLYNKQSYFANKEAYIQNVGLLVSRRIQ